MEAEDQFPVHPSLHSIAITGMDIVGTDFDGLGLFEDAIYTGRVFPMELEEDMAGNGNTASADARFKDIKAGDFSFPPAWFNLTTHQIQELNRSQKLLLRVAAGALHDGCCLSNKNLERTAVNLFAHDRFHRMESH